jgi:ABC-type molybdenum transport system ATPase subunit/photorepair protein PhrA
MRLFGSSRLPEPGSGQTALTFWDIQSRIGHSSPEIHQHMPRNLTIRQVIASAWADTFRSKPKLGGQAKAKVDACLRWFEPELHPRNTVPNTGDELSWANEYLFGELSFSAQRVLLFLRAIVKNPDIVVLDEAFSGMDDAVRDKCALFLEHGEEKVFAPARTVVYGKEGTHDRHGDNAVVDGTKPAQDIAVRGLSNQQALICISHIKEEVPDCVREWVCLPEASTRKPARFGRLDGPLRLDSRRWNEIWGM